MKSRLDDNEGPEFMPASQSTLIMSTAVEYTTSQSGIQSAQGPDGSTSIAVEARLITPNDTVIIAAKSDGIPTTAPIREAYKPTLLKHRPDSRISNRNRIEETRQVSRDANNNATARLSSGSRPREHEDPKRPIPASRGHPLFPPLPQYGPPSLIRDLQCWIFRLSSFILSTSFLGIIVLVAFITDIPATCYRTWLRLTFRNADASRPLYEEEVRRNSLRKEQEAAWKRSKSAPVGENGHESPLSHDGFCPTEGGPDRMVRNVRYYARRVGLDVEEFEVETEDGFIIDLWHVYDPRENTISSNTEKSDRRPNSLGPTHKPKFPVLLIPGLLESAGTYCVNEDDSLAFYLSKSGYDVWLGNNRCGFHPKHKFLDYSDPRMWSWNIRQMGMFDLSALTSRVLHETGFAKLGLICHSQGTAETFIALAKEHRPELGEKLTVFCALAPAVYAADLIDKPYFRFMRLISPTVFRLVFGIHAFIPIMMPMHPILHPRLYGWLGYKVFSFLFGWTDARWDRAYKPRMFQFCPVYISAESMRWWLGTEGFAKHRCILATEEEVASEEREWISNGTLSHIHPSDHSRHISNPSTDPMTRLSRASTAWYNEQVPPFALWVAGNDNLVNGEKLLRRFEQGREPYVKVVHSKVIPEYEHLDVIWAMDVVDKVFKEVREVLWKTCDARDKCRVPTGCESVPAWRPSSVVEKSIDVIEQTSSN